MGEEVWVDWNQRKCGFNHPDYRVIMDIVDDQKQFPLSHPPVNCAQYIQLAPWQGKVLVANLPSNEIERDRAIKRALEDDLEGRERLGFISRKRYS
jgi:hypothetical protein